ncbi:MAG: hypothetical protein U1E82_11560 [Nitrosomonas sp.]|nr:hypothetical protein [Nitrosomonas sp.]
MAQSLRMEFTGLANSGMVSIESPRYSLAQNNTAILDCRNS